MQRSSVDLPEPDAPISATTSCSSTARSMPSSTVCLPNDLTRPSTTRDVAHASRPACRLRRSRATSQSVKRASGIVSATNEHRRREVRSEVEGRVRVDLRLVERLDCADRRNERAVLLQPDEVVEERRDHAPHGLRQDHAARRLPARKPERSRRRLLARMHRLDPRAVDLADVRAVDEDERDDPPERRRGRHVLQPERRGAEAEHRDHEDRRKPAEDVRVDDRRARESERTPAPAGCAGRRARARRRG